MSPRPYQLEAMEALDRYLAERDGNPCIVLPTGSGKTPFYCWTLQKYLMTWPRTRVIILAHIRELLEQGVEKMRAIWPQAPIGVYSAGLRSRDIGYSITFASIQSVYSKACTFDPFDLIFIDEAHRIPFSQDGQYRRFIAEAKLNNPQCRVVGLTATPYRLGGGAICHSDYILNDVAYDANVKDLIDQGYLCPLRTKVGRREIDTAGVKQSKGEFDTKQLEQRACVDETVDGIATEAVAMLNRENRRAVLFFCVTIDHAEKVSAALAQLGMPAHTIHANTPAAVRSALIRDFTAGKLRGLVNVNVLSEGFDAQRIDAVCLIRPTASKGLYYQQVGRGLRIHPDKGDCLILDFAGNVSRHGPIDLLAGQSPKMVNCGNEDCREHFPGAIGSCPQCGWTVPPGEPVAAASEGSEREIPTDPRARSERSILSSGEPWEVAVKDVSVRLHEKQGKPTSLMVTYDCGLEQHREWICLNHDGYARRRAASWWTARFGQPVPVSAEAAMTHNLFLDRMIADRTAAIIVRQSGKYTEVINWKLRQQIGAVA